MRWILSILFLACTVSAQMPPRVLDDLLMARIASSGSSGYDFSAFCVGNWHLDESSGPRADSSTNNYTLTDVNSPGVISGVISNAMTVTNAASQRISANENATVMFGSRDWTICGWFNMRVTNSLQFLVSRYNTSGNQRSYFLDWNQTLNMFAMGVYSGGGATPVAGVNSTNAMGGALNVWKFVACGRNGSDLWMSVNAGTRSVNVGGAINSWDGTADFFIGGSASASFATAFIDEVGVWNGRSLTDAELTYLYNSGNGRRIIP